MPQEPLTIVFPAQSKVLNPQLLSWEQMRKGSLLGILQKDCNLMNVKQGVSKSECMLSEPIWDTHNLNK